VREKKTLPEIKFLVTVLNDDDDDDVTHTEMRTVTSYTLASATDAPIVNCESSWAYVGDRNVFVRCKVKARPKVTAIFWILDGNGTTVTEGQVVNEHWTLVMVGIVACNRH